VRERPSPNVVLSGANFEWVQRDLHPVEGGGSCVQNCTRSPNFATRTLRQNQTGSFLSEIRLTTLGSRWSKKSLAPVPNSAIAFISSLEYEVKHIEILDYPLFVGGLRDCDDPTLSEPP
jgi:hypothetical protein